MRRRRLNVTLVVLFALLGACGGGGDGGSGDDGATKAPPVLGGRSEDEEAARALGFPGFATKNTTRVGGADPVADAAGVARAVFPARSRETRPDAVALVDVDDWRSAISAGLLAGGPLRAAILFSREGELPDATEEALEELDPVGAETAGDAQVLRVGAAPVPDDLEVRDVVGRDHAAVARAIDELQTVATGRPSEQVIVAPSERPSFAMPAAALAAKTGAPVLWASVDELPAATEAAIKEHDQPKIYVIGPEEAISDRVVTELRDLGAVERVSGDDPVRNAIAVARYADGSFGWNVIDPGHGLVFASAERPADAAAAAPLAAAGKYGPLLLVTDAAALPDPVEAYLLDIQPGYDKDPVRGVYNHGWLMGDEEAIAVDVQARIDALLEIQPVEPS